MPRILPIVPRKPGGFREASWTRGCPTRASTSARPDFRPRAWTDELPPLDAFATLIFQVAGQQLSVASTRAIITHLQQRFEGHMPSPAELLAADPKVLRDSGFSSRKGDTLRALAQRFVDGRLSEEAFAGMALRRTIQREYALDHLPTDEELLELSDRWRPYRSLAVSYLFASE